MASQAALPPPPNFGRRERAEWRGLPDDAERAGYLLYRSENRAEVEQFARRDRYRMVENWRNLSADEKWDFMGRAGFLRGLQRPATEAERRLLEEYRRRYYGTPSPPLPSPITSDHQLHSRDEDDEHGDLPAGEWRMVETLYWRRTGGRVPVKRMVTLHLQVDERGNIQDRAVLKRVMTDNLIHPAVIDSFLAEARLMDRLPNCWSISSLHHPKSYALDGDPDGLRTVRTYTKYAPSGDLLGLIATYNETPERQVPEPFVWYVFLALSDAIYALNTGRCPNDDKATEQGLNKTRREDWNALVHRDIKPPNVFLGPPTGPYQGYPTPLVADFDFAIEQDALVGMEHEVKGTPCYMAPEMDNNSFGHMITDKNDIWSAAMTVWNLMHTSASFRNQQIIMQAAAQNFTWKDGDSMPDGENSLIPPPGIYSSQLRDLVRRCLKRNPNERPDFLQLRRQIAEDMHLLRPVLGNWKERDLPRHLRLRYKPDRFPVGTAAPAHIPQRRRAGNN